jgi:hypothetical protein
MCFVPCIDSLCAQVIFNLSSTQIGYLSLEIVTFLLSKLLYSLLTQLNKLFFFAQVLIFLWHKTWTFVKWNNGLLISILLASSRNDQNEKFFYNLLKVQMQMLAKGSLRKTQWNFLMWKRHASWTWHIFHDYFFIDLMYDGTLFKQRYKWEDVYFLQSWIWLWIMMHILFRRNILPMF